MATGLVFHQSESHQTDYRSAFQNLVRHDRFPITFNKKLANEIHLPMTAGHDQQLTLVYSYGDYSNVEVRRLSTVVKKPITVTRASVVPANKIISFFSDPFAQLDKAKTAPLVIKKAAIGPVRSASNGWLTAVLLFIFASFYAAGPGVCVWLALSELMPTRIRSNGMSIALLINQAVATVIASVFLPVVGSHGYATMFFFWAGCTVIYFIAAAFFLPETRGKTLKEIEAHFEGKTAGAVVAAS